jgi:N-acetylmuramoyl-L-alanine amidase CwlA
MEIVQYYQTNNPCYKAGKKIKPSGIVVHSTGANNPHLKRYVGPDDGILGKNTSGNHWNRAESNKCMHAFIGKVADGSIKVYQTLPWDYRCWGVGSGKKGSYNSTHIQFEICEDDLTSEKYYNETFQAAKELCAFLCRKYGISVDNVVGHYEAAEAGYGSNHADPRNWQKKHGGSMAQFRADVKAMLGQVEQTTVKVPEKAPTVETKTQDYTTYTVKKGDTLWRIAHNKLGSGNRYKDIMTVSGLKNDRLKIGQTLKIPKA